MRITLRSHEYGVSHWKQSQDPPEDRQLQREKLKNAAKRKAQEDLCGRPIKLIHAAIKKDVHGGTAAGGTAAGGTALDSKEINKWNGTQFGDDDIDGRTQFECL